MYNTCELLSRVPAHPKWLKLSFILYPIKYDFLENTKLPEVHIFLLASHLMWL